MLIALVCTQCGGKLEVETSHVLKSENNNFIVSAGQTLKCAHCKTEYVAGEKIKSFQPAPVISISGNVVGSNIIIGSGTIINDKPISETSEEIQEKPAPINPPAEIKAKEEKASKQWWQVWKK